MNIPADSDGVLCPHLIPVAAFLRGEEYDDSARGRVLGRLADGVTPRACALAGALQWRDLPDVERLLAGARPPAAAPAPCRGGSPAAPDDIDLSRYGDVPARLPWHDALAEWRRGLAESD